MKLVQSLSKPSAFGLSLGLLLLIIYASMQDWGVLGVIFIVLAYFLGFATSSATSGALTSSPIEDTLKTLDPDMRSEITRLTKNNQLSEAVSMIKSTTTLNEAQAKQLVDQIAQR